MGYSDYLNEPKHKHMIKKMAQWLQKLKVLFNWEVKF